MEIIFVLVIIEILFLILLNSSVYELLPYRIQGIIELTILVLVFLIIGIALCS